MKLRRSWIIALAAGLALAGWVAGSPARALNALAALNSLRAEEGTAYGPLPRQRFDLYKPGGAAPARGWPLAVFFYGGSWNKGERGDYRFVGEALAARGIMVMVADYRLYPEVRYPEFLNDCALALAHGLTQAAAWGADPARVFVMGHSAGAYNAAMLALDPRWLAGTGHRIDELAGWIGLAGPYDFVPIRNPDVQPVFYHPNVPPDSQAIRYADTSTLRAFLAAPQADSFVNPVRNTRQMAEHLAAHGAQVTLREYPGVNHLSLVGALALPLRALAPVLADVTAFVGAAEH